MVRSLVFEKMPVGFPAERLHEMAVLVLLPQDLLPMVLLVEAILVCQSPLHRHYLSQLALSLCPLAHFVEELL